MEEESQLPTHRIINNKEDEEEEGTTDEEFYEKIEAPKFVDLTVPDPYRPDDRYWFCLRVGCDRKHEEEMDPEAIYKDFVLRVMAARSPNIRLRKALNAKNSRTNVKCPLSAPAKSSKSRLSRLAMVSSISQKLVDPKGKVRPLMKLSSTPMAKSKQVAAKYMTTPRNKRCLPDANSLRSVPNAKPTTIAVPKNRMVAKALVFHSPKKGISLKSSIELRTPLTKICEGMKRLEITSQRKQRVLGYSSKSSKHNTCNSKKSLPIGPSRKQLSACEEKSWAKDCLRPQNCKDLEAKSIRCMKSKSKGNLIQQCHSTSKEMVENDSSDMDIDVKSRGGSAVESSMVNEGSGHEELLTTVKKLENFGSTDSTKEETVVLSSGADVPRFQALNEERDSGSDETEREDNMKSSSENEGSDKIHPTVYQNLEGAGHESEVTDNDDKENAASDDNREFNHNNHQSGRRILSRQDTHKDNKKAAQAQDKNFKDGLVSTTTTGAPEMKYRKPKPTNPKPFRLRTDERGILKEANLERKIRFLAPRKESTTISRLPAGISQRRHGDNIQRNEKCSEQTKCNNGSEKESEKNVPNVEPKRRRATSLKTSRDQVRPQLASVTPQRPFKSLHQKPNSMTSSLHEYSKDNASQKSDNRIRKTKSPSLQRQLVSHREVASSRKATASHMKRGQQLGVIKETSSKVSKPVEAGKPSENGATDATKATASRSSSQGRKRHVTVPKEPNFHSTHVPKSCTRKLA